MKLRELFTRRRVQLQHRNPNSIYIERKEWISKYELQNMAQMFSILENRPILINLC